MENNAVDKKKLGKQIEKSIKKNVLTSFEYGEISIKDLKDYERLWPKLKKVIFGDQIVDYKTSILDQARKFSDSHLVDFARVFYAIYFEHLINRIIHVVAHRKGMSPFSIKNILRFSKIEDKLTWLLEVLELPKLNPEYLRILQSLFEKRNSFVHYKWNFTQLEKMQSGKSWAEEQKDIEKSILYMKRFEARAIFKNQKSKIKKEVSEINFSVKVGNPIKPRPRRVKLTKRIMVPIIK